MSTSIYFYSLRSSSIRFLVRSFSFNISFCLSFSIIRLSTASCYSVAISYCILLTRRLSISYYFLHSNRLRLFSSATYLSRSSFSMRCLYYLERVFSSSLMSYNLFYCSRSSTYAFSSTASSTLLRYFSCNCLSSSVFIFNRNALLRWDSSSCSLLNISVSNFISAAHSSSSSGA
jgi:hypothetical protein